MYIQPSDDESSQQTEQKLRFASDGTFRITVFSDTHFGEASHQSFGAQNDAQSVEVMRKVLKAENQQLVVLNGDLITGDDAISDKVTDFLDQIVAPINEAGLPWASTYGNHDNQPRLLSKNIFKREKTYKNSLTQSMVPNSSEFTGVTNYYLPVYAASGPQTIPALILWFFDSRGGFRYGTTQSKANARPEWVDKSVVDWFTKTKSGLSQQYKTTIPSLAFFHIPLYSTYAFQKHHGVDHSKEPGMNNEVVCPQGPPERLTPQPDDQNWDNPFMRALLDTNGLLATFSGHDHENDWCFKWNDTISGRTLQGNGIDICYGRHTGYGGYGNLPRGGRHIFLKQDTLKREVQTWIRLEDGLVTGNVTLNSTYGQDEYFPPRYPHRALTIQNLNSGHSAEMYAIGILMAALFYLLFRRWKSQTAMRNSLNKHEHIDVKDRIP